MNKQLKYIKFDYPFEVTKWVNNKENKKIKVVSITGTTGNITVYYWEIYED